jgi:predicted AlkP superfamily phosphohydrolase/phosphomutase
MSMDKRKWLCEHGYLKIVKGLECISTKGVALVSDVDEERLRKFIKSGEKTFPDNLARDMKRGAQGLMARFGSDDMIEILYARAKEVSA